VEAGRWEAGQQEQGRPAVRYCEGAWIHSIAKKLQDQVQVAERGCIRVTEVHYTQHMQVLCCSGLLYLHAHVLSHRCCCCCNARQFCPTGPGTLPLPLFVWLSQPAQHTSAAEPTSLKCVSSIAASFSLTLQCSFSHTVTSTVLGPASSAASITRMWLVPETT
jgi:hypothetical protein